MLNSPATKLFCKFEFRIPLHFVDAPPEELAGIPLPGYNNIY